MTNRRTPTAAQIRAAANDPRLLAALATRNNPKHQWSDDAACRDRDPDSFFPDPSSKDAGPLAICAGCPVAAWCLASAITTGATFGVRNSTETERLAMSYAWKQAVHVPTPPPPAEPELDPCPHGHGQRLDRTGRPYCPACHSERGRLGNAKRWAVAS